MTLIPHEATSMTDALQVMRIRNVCRDGFSTHTEIIWPDEQRVWWAETEGRRGAWLYRAHDAMEYVGFGLLLKRDDDCWTTTVAVLPDYRGHNYGKAIMHDIVTRCPGPCRGTARKDNPAAVRLHIADDWDMVDGPDPRLVYFRARAGVTA